MRPKAKLITKSIKIHENQQAMLDSFIVKWGFVSESEVVRQSLTFFFRKYNPAYLELSPYEKEREKELTETEKIKLMPDREYVITMAKGYVYTDPETEKVYAIIHGIANYLYAIPLEEIKTWVKQNPQDFSYHLAIRDGRNIVEDFRGNRTRLREKYGVTVPEIFDELEDQSV